jgi:hypothetical protein
MTLDPIHKADDFVAALRSFMERQGMNISQMAAHMKKGRGAIEHYLYTPPIRPEFRRKVVEQYPEVFTPQTEDTTPATAGATSDRPTLKMRDLSVLMKVEQSRSLVAGLTAQLTWFLYEASETERNLFRDELGGTWEHFQQLVRAMHGETAFKVAKSEGRL